MKIIWCMIREIFSWTIFCPFTPSPLPPPNNPENQNFEKMKKTPGDIIILHKCTINDNHMIYGSWDMKSTRQNFFVILGHFLKNFKKNFMVPFYGWGSTASRLVPLWGGSLLYTTKFPDIPGTHFTDLRRMKGWLDLRATQWFRTRDSWIGNPAP